MNDLELHDLIARSTPLDQAKLATLSIDAEATELCDRIIASPILHTTERAAEVASRAVNGQRRHRRLVLILAAAIAALALAGAGWAGLRARTGVFSTGGESGTGEFIRLYAPDAEQIVDELARGIPLPPGQSFDSWKENMVGPDAGRFESGVVMSESGIRSSLEHSAACTWTGYWLDGFNRGDEQQMAEALPVLEEIPSWPAIVASDGDGGRVVESLRVRAQGARDRNPGLFLRGYLLNCQPFEARQ